MLGGAAAGPCVLGEDHGLHTLRQGTPPARPCQTPRPGDAHALGHVLRRAGHRRPPPRRTPPPPPPPRCSPSPMPPIPTTGSGLSAHHLAAKRSSPSTGACTCLRRGAEHGPHARRSPPPPPAPPAPSPAFRTVTPTSRPRPSSSRAASGGRVLVSHMHPVRAREQRQVHPVVEQAQRARAPAARPPPPAPAASASREGVRFIRSCSTRAPPSSSRVAFSSSEQLGRTLSSQQRHRGLGEAWTERLDHVRQCVDRRPLL